MLNKIQSYCATKIRFNASLCDTERLYSVTWRSADPAWAERQAGPGGGHRSRQREQPHLIMFCHSAQIILTVGVALVFGSYLSTLIFSYSELACSKHNKKKTNLFQIENYKLQLILFVWNMEYFIISSAEIAKHFTFISLEP